MFLFQAEDGIRDYKVTGVQTCALPILQLLASNCITPTKRSSLSWPTIGPAWAACRSEERRVGKECRSQGSTNCNKQRGKRDSGRRQRTGDGNGRCVRREDDRQDYSTRG